MVSITDRIFNRGDDSDASDEPKALYVLVLLFGPAVGFLLGGGGVALLLGLFCVALLHAKEPELASQLNERVAKELDIYDSK